LAGPSGPLRMQADKYRIHTHCQLLQGSRDVEHVGAGVLI
jgi:hypothetical protein